MTNNWLANLKTGDRVYINRGSTFVDFFPPELFEATPERGKRCNAAFLRNELREVVANIHKLSVDQIERMLLIAKEHDHDT